jgi:hypothetical protein
MWKLALIFFFFIEDCTELGLSLSPVCRPFHKNDYNDDDDGDENGGDDDDNNDKNDDV